MCIDVSIILVDAIRNLKNQLSSRASVFINSFKTDRKICLAKLECQWEKFTFHKSNPKWDKFYYTTDYFCLPHIKARTTKKSLAFSSLFCFYTYTVSLPTSDLQGQPICNLSIHPVVLSTAVIGITNYY